LYTLIDQTAQQLPTFLLVFFRLLALLMIMPIFGYSSVIRPVRLALTLILAILVLPLVTRNPVSLHSFPQLLLMIAKEILIGLMIGFGARLIFEALTTAGRYVSQQMGLAMANVLDPASQQQLPIIGQFWFLLFVVFIFSAGGHHFLVRVMTQHFSLIPVTGGQFPARLGRNLIHGGSMMFVQAVKIAAPVLIFMLVVDASLALVARVMPQMNIFIVSLPLKLGAGMFALISSLHIFQIIFSGFFSTLTEFMNSIIKAIA